MPDHSRLKRNIPLVYVLTAFYYALFWAPIWVIYYLRFTNYQGIGIIEMVAYGMVLLGEIPTGAIADMLGKKKTIILSFLFVALGNSIMAFAPSYDFLLLSVIAMAVGGALASGTYDALVYDSLLSLKQEHTFDHVLGRISAIKMAAQGGAAILGGLTYSYWVGFPFLLVSCASIIGIMVSLLIKEPPIDSVIFSFKNYVKQMGEGAQQLFSKGNVRTTSVIIITLTMITVMNGNSFIDIQLAGLGWDPALLGFWTAIIFFTSAGISLLTPHIARKWGSLGAVFLSALGIAVTMILIPWMGMLPATLLLVLRNGTLEIFGNNASAIIHAQTESKYRATTISTYSLLSQIPYVLLIVPLGSLMDLWSVHTTVLCFGVLLVGFVGIGLVIRNRSNPSVVQ